MPSRNSWEKPATASSLTPSARKPSLVTAICSAESGSGFNSTALVTDTPANQARAAGTSRTRSSRNTASV